jgi:small multidrug resistance family-3 protein
MLMKFLIWPMLIAAALLEVGGDAVIRKGLRGSGWAVIAAGCLMLASYGVVVNLVKWDFSKLLGVYVAVFAVAGVLWGRLVFKETVPVSTWLGLAIILVGGLVIQFGQR